MCMFTRKETLSFSYLQKAIQLCSMNIKKYLNLTKIIFSKYKSNAVIVGRKKVIGEMEKENDCIIG